MKITAVILAAGHGKRMVSKVPKVLHPLARRPMIHYSIDNAAAASTETPVVVIGHGAESVRAEVGEKARFVVQAEQLGTAHALQTARPLLEGQTDLVLLVTADMPLITTGTMQKMITAQVENSGPLAMLTVVYADPRGFGRVLRGPDGHVLAIVEEAQATLEQLEIRELNASVYCFRADWLWPALEKIEKSPKGEYYLTDIVAVAARQGLAVKALVAEDPDETIGINNRAYLAEAEAILRRRINHRWMDAGVTLIDPGSIYIEPDVIIGQDTVIHPNTHLRGQTAVGTDCVIGPNTILTDTKIGNSCTIMASVLTEAILEDDVQVGPFGHVGSGAHLASGVRLGNFAEVNRSSLGPRVTMEHFSYLGDARIEAEVNIGAGTVTCNEDGPQQHSTVIGAGASIGSDTLLIAPVTIGAGAKTGAGALVNRDVPPNTTVVGVPAHPLNKQDKGER